MAGLRFVFCGVLIGHAVWSGLGTERELFELDHAVEEFLVLDDPGCESGF